MIDVILEPPSKELRRTLVLVTKVLQNMSQGVKFGDKEAFMTQFNTLLDENKNKMDRFYQLLIVKSHSFIYIYTLIFIIIIIIF